jgi:uncharacterized protein YlxW (UPF0749 family)
VVRNWAIAATFLFSLVLGGCAKNTDSKPAALRAQDLQLSTQFDKLQKSYQSGSISKPDYLARLRELRERELQLLDQARAAKLDDPLEYNYWHRGRLKFPSRIQMELEQQSK